MIMTGILALTPHIKAGRIKALAVTSPRRNPSMPELPTIAESGVPGFDVRVWFGVFAPAGTPRPIIAMLNDHIRKIVETPEIRSRMIDQGADPATNTPEEFAALVKS